MALNPQYDAIGQAFAQQYYSTFDERNFVSLMNFYNVHINKDYVFISDNSNLACICRQRLLS